MIVEVISVGTELLLGQIVNTNATTIGSVLTEKGFDSNYHVTVGDNMGRLTQTIRIALERSDAVILTGGLGPTPDDLTRQAICAATERDMDRAEDHAERIRQRIMARRGVVADSSLRMADLPNGAEPLPNTQGVALGIALLHGGKWIFAVPGVPREMRAMLVDEIIPRLETAAGTASVIRSRTLHTWGHGESHVAELLDDLYASTNPSIAFLTSDMDVRVRITAKASDDASAEALLSPVEAEIRRRLGSAVFASDDETGLDVITEHLASRGWQVAVGEVGTLGWVGSQLAMCPMDVYAGGTTWRTGDGTASDLAYRAREAFDAEVGIGISNPEVVDDSGQPASIFTISVVTPDGAEDRAMRFFGTGEHARSYAVIAALHLLRLALAGDWWESVR